MTVFTKRAIDVFAPTTAGGAARGGDMGEAQTWGVEVEGAVIANEAAIATGLATEIATRSAADVALDHRMTDVEATAAARISNQIVAAVATTANITLAGEQSIDGVMTAGSVVLAKNQTNANENGVYVSQSGYWARHPDANTGAKYVGLSVYVTGGTANGKTTWLCIATATSTTFPFVILGAGAQSIKVTGGTKNLFDWTAVTEGQEVYADGSLQPQADSSISDYIFVKGMGSVTIRGLQAGSTAGPYARFLAANKTTSVKVESLAAAMVLVGGLTSAVTIPVPPDAVWLQFSPRQRNSSAGAYGGIQLEPGTRASTAESYTPRIVAVDGNPAPAQRRPAFLLFGDSITETATKDMSGGYTEGTRSNWPRYAMPMLGADPWYNYATSGASFKEYTGQQDLQKISNQVARAYADGRFANYVVLAAGTNDPVITLSGGVYAATFPDLGDYATAMGKATLADLDRSKTLEAARWAMWSIQIHWPNATPFLVLPIQRSEIEPTALQTLCDGLRAMAQRYGFIVIDGAAEAGIVRDFETPGAAGRDLSDGLHPLPSGQIKIARLIVSYVIRYILGG